MTAQTSTKKIGAVILCGGQCSRMGFPKHELWFDGKTFLQAVAESVGQVTDVVTAVVAYGAEPPDSLPGNVQVVSDERPNLGPLEGIRTGLVALEDQVSHAFVTSCDVPKLQPRLIHKLIQLLGDEDAVVPHDGDRVYGMTAIYRTSLHAKIDQIYASGVSRRVSTLQERARTRIVPLEHLKPLDPELDSFTNVNTVSQYFDLLKRAGMTCPADIMERLSAQ